MYTLVRLCRFWNPTTKDTPGPAASKIAPTSYHQRRQSTGHLLGPANSVSEGSTTNRVEQGKRRPQRQHPEQGQHRPRQPKRLKHSPLDLTLPTRGPCIYCSSEHNSKVFGKVKIELNSAIYDLQACRGLTTLRWFCVLEKITVQVLVEQGRH